MASRGSCGLIDERFQVQTWFDLKYPIYFLRGFWKRMVEEKEEKAIKEKKRE